MALAGFEGTLRRGHTRWWVEVAGGTHYILGLIFLLCQRPVLSMGPLGPLHRH